MKTGNTFNKWYKLFQIKNNLKIINCFCVLKMPQILSTKYQKNPLLKSFKK